MNYYDSISKGYNSLYMNEQCKKFEIIKKLVKGGLVLDLGCGTGFITEKLGNVVGIDYSINMLKLCQKGLNLVCANAELLPFKDNSFDTIISMTVLQDVDDVVSSVSEIKRVLKPDGRIILSVLNKKKIEEIRKVLKDNFRNLSEKENYNDVVFFTQ